MSTTLIQKHPLRGTREFRLVDDEVQYTIKSPLKTDSLSVVLNVLDSEPEISGSMLAFLSKVNREPLVELFLNKPDKETFEAFVKTMQAGIRQEDFGQLRVNEKGVDVNLEQLRESIDMLQAHINPAEIETLLSTLRKLEANPADQALLGEAANAFNELGFVQGQVLTYAPYINFLLSGGSRAGSIG